MLIISVVILILIGILTGICKNKMNKTCTFFIVFNVLCVLYYLNKKENYLVRENVKDISTFLL